MTRHDTDELPTDPTTDPSEAAIARALEPGAPPADLADRVFAASAGELPAPTETIDPGLEADLAGALSAQAPDAAADPELADRAAGAALAARRRQRFEVGMARALAPDAPAGVARRIFEATRRRLPGRDRIIGRVGRRRLRQLAAAAILVMEAGVWLTIVGIAEDARALNAVDAELNRAAAFTGPDATIDHEMQRLHDSLAELRFSLDAPFEPAEPLASVVLEPPAGTMPADDEPTF